MRKSINFLFFSILLFSIKGIAQEKVDYQYIDSVSYGYYLGKNWKELVYVSKTGLKNDIDYYYLRMRTGIAYFEQGNYLKAEKHFKKALHFNNLDQEASDYYFYSNLFSGKKDHAKYVYHKYNQKTEKLPEALPKPTSSILISSAYLMNTNKQALNNLIPDNPPGVDGYQMVTNSLLYNSILLKHDITPAIYLSHSFGLINKSNYYINYYLGELSESTETKLNQYQYYASLKFIPADKIFITGGFHFIKFSSSNIQYKEISSGINYNVPGISNNNIAGDIAVYKSFWLMNAGAGITFANLNNYTQFQQNFSLTFYPLGNLNFYLVSKLNLINEQYQNNTPEKNILFRNTLGFKIFNYLWMEGTMWNGQFKNAALDEGWLIMNSNDNITSKFDVTALVPLKKIQIRFLFSDTKYFTSLFTTQVLDTYKNKSEFKNLTYLLAIKWNI